MAATLTSVGTLSDILYAELGVAEYWRLDYTGGEMYG